MFTFWYYFNNQNAAGASYSIIYYTTLYAVLQVLTANFLDFNFYSILYRKIGCYHFLSKVGRSVYILRLTGFLKVLGALGFTAMSFFCSAKRSCFFCAILQHFRMNPCLAKQEGRRTELTAVYPFEFSHQLSNSGLPLFI